MAAITALDAAWLGIHYLDAETITLNFQPSAPDWNTPATTASVGSGATSWTLTDGNGNTAGSGTMSSSATSITVVSGGAFVGGSTIYPGDFLMATASGTNMIVVGGFSIGPTTSTGSNLYVPNASGDSLPNFSAWLGCAADRDYYGYEPTASNNSPGEGWNASNIIANRAADKYFTGPQDSARPHKFWLSAYAQANSPTQDPTSAGWGNLATALVEAGYTGAYYECPTNEFENGGWSVSAMITYWNACAAAILAADSTAHVMGPCSAGVYANSAISMVGTFLAGATSTVSAFTNHDENSYQNLPNLVALDQNIGGKAAAFATAGVPNMDLWATETGISDVNYGLMMVRGVARQRTMWLFMRERYGFAKEQCYFFPYFDHHGSGLPMYMCECTDDGLSGVVRPGGVAVHVMSEALYGLACSPSNRPAWLAFGASGSAADSCFKGSHYTGTTSDRVLLATNCIESATVTLAASAAPTQCWDGWGAPRTWTNNGNGTYTFAVDDLLTYIWFPVSTVVSVVDTDQDAVALSKLLNLVHLPNTGLINESDVSAVGPVNNNSFAENNQNAASGSNGIPGVITPYVDTNTSGSLTVSTLAGSAIQGYVVFAPGAPWDNVGWGLLNIALSLNGVTVDSWSSASGTSFAIPSPSGANSSAVATRTSWWKQGSARLVKFTPQSAATAVLSVTPSWGLAPDAASNTAATTPSNWSKWTVGSTFTGNHTLAGGDVLTELEYNSASAGTFTISSGLATSDIEPLFGVRAIGSGMVTVVAGGGVTLTGIVSTTVPNQLLVFNQTSANVFVGSLPVYNLNTPPQVQLCEFQIFDVSPGGWIQPVTLVRLGGS